MYALFAFFSFLNHVSLPTYIYFSLLYTVYLDTLYSFTQYSVAKSREGVVRGIV